jgi:FkbM family methyltransferase
MTWLHEISSFLFQIFHRLTMATIRITARDKMKWFSRYDRQLLGFGSVKMARTYFGSVIVGDINDYIIKRVFYFGVWEPSVSHVIEQILRDGDVFVDVGANIGYDSLLAATRVGLNGRVVAIEAFPPMFAQLKINVELNSLANVRLVEVAASSREGHLILYGGDAWNQGKTSPIQRVGLRPLCTVPMQPLDLILSADERQSTRLIKIDIEGGEVEVLKRLLATLDLFSRKLIVLVEMSPADCGAELKAIFDRFTAEGFSAFAVENLYDLSHYLNSRGHRPPVRVYELPNEQCDILFQRE